uniref:cAMP regulated phosphoprotein 19 n=1 Tax=Sander lucioperca TaxID=283035 RepID=A0A8C9Y422_SANLU
VAIPPPRPDIRGELKKQHSSGKSSHFQSICSVLFLQEMEDKVISPENVEEAKLKARYPNLGAKPGGSDLLRTRLQKRPMHLDSGDYNMAKAKMKNKQLPSAPTEKTEITGGHIPTLQDMPQRKTSIVASKLAG